MARSGARPPSRRDLLGVRQFRLRLEVELPDVPLLCMVAPIEEPVAAAEVIVNAGHGLLAYKHAAFHVDRPLRGPRVCWVGLDCGYVETRDGDDGADELDISSWGDGAEWGDELDVGVNGVT